MRKLLTLLVFAFLFFGCASKDTEAENLSEIPEIPPVVEENLQIDDDLLDETEIPQIQDVLLVDSDDYFIENIQNSIGNEDEIPVDEDLESLLIFPEDFEAPDYVEFLPVIKDEITSDVDENLDIQEDEQSEDSLLDDDIDFVETPDFTEDNLENPPEDLVHIPENTDFIDDLIDFDQVDSLGDLPLQDDFTVLDTDDSIVEDSLTTNQDDFELSQDDESLHSDTVDIPLEEIFTPDEDFIPLEPVETEVATPTRSMIMNNNQKLLVIYPGSGWIFLGDEYDSNTLIFDKRNIYDETTEFVFRSSESGEALLHFYKQDLLTNEPINDYLLVTINPKKGKFETIEAPEYTFGTFVEEDAFMDEYYEEEYYDYGIIEDEPEVMFFTDEEYFFPDEAVSVEEIMDLAEAFYEDKMYIEALDQLDYYFTVTDGTADEYTDYALFMKGQILEQNSACKNIKESLNAYKELVNNYPDSDYWNKAQDRAVYLERFYFSVR